MPSQLPLASVVPSGLNATLSILKVNGELDREGAQKMDADEYQNANWDPNVHKIICFVA